MATATYRQMTGPDGLLARRASFTGNSMAAEWCEQSKDGYPFLRYGTTGRLAGDDLERFYDDRQSAYATGQRFYVVWSYHTPIAWAVGESHAYIAAQSFSVTTSKQQNYVRAWLNHRHPAPDTVSESVPPTPEYLAERERLFGCKHTEWRWLDCEDCSESGVICDVKVCVACGESVVGR